MTLLKRLKAAGTFKAKEILLPASKKQINMLCTAREGTMWQAPKSGPKVLTAVPGEQPVRKWDFISTTARS